MTDSSPTNSAATTTQANPAAPSSTYRLQVRPSLTLDDATDLVEQLSQFGIGAVYLSPILRATSGSDHGYDTTDPTEVDPERGGTDGLTHLVDAAAKAGLGVVVDIVPNHLGISAPAENPAWWSVLELGPESPYADWFDIDWTRAPILVPILGEGHGLDQLEIVDGQLGYYEHRFPLAPGSWQDGDDLADVVARQHYRLADWRIGDSELNYRRFFTVTTLAGVRQEDPAVFEATHARVADWIATGKVTGLRVDHPDGLADPGEYFDRLRELAPEAWLVAEKILEPAESLPAWKIQGTTGYDAMTEVNQVFVDPAAETLFEDAYRNQTGDELSMAEHIVVGKRRAANELLIAERDRIVRLLQQELPDAGTDQRAAAVAELATHLPVYRSYRGAGDEIDQALTKAQQSRPDLAELLGKLAPLITDATLEVCRRFEQYTGAVMAKGVEDTAYYRHTRFVAANEVGGDPDHFGLAPSDFHAAQQHRAANLPESMTSLATHDTKRGEDVRARLAVLSEIGEEFTGWTGEFLSSTAIPDASLGWLIAQTFAGAGLIEPDRMHAYVEKAMREASLGTSWTAVDEGFEAAAHAAVDKVYDDDDLRLGLERILERIEQPGWSNSLSQKLVQLTMPGIPDVYQGTELWDDSLVDPDNRRPVNWTERRALLGLRHAPGLDESGAAKFWVVRRALTLRRDRPELFTGYTPVTAADPGYGSRADHFLGFDRGGALTCATRLPIGLADKGNWQDTTVDLPEGQWRDDLTGKSHSGTVEVRKLFAQLPVALLVRG